MATWPLRPKPQPTEDHEPHLPHEDRSTQMIGAVVTLALGAVFVLGTLALFA
jgi:hypothetical protein